MSLSTYVSIYLSSHLPPPPPPPSLSSSCGSIPIACDAGYLVSRAIAAPKSTKNKHTGLVREACGFRLTAEKMLGLLSYLFVSLYSFCFLLFDFLFCCFVYYFFFSFLSLFCVVGVLFIFFFFHDNSFHLVPFLYFSVAFSIFLPCLTLRFRLFFISFSSLSLSPFSLHIFQISLSFLSLHLLSFNLFLSFLIPNPSLGGFLFSSIFLFSFSLSSFSFQLSSFLPLFSKHYISFFLLFLCLPISPFCLSKLMLSPYSLFYSLLLLLFCFFPFSFHLFVFPSAPLSIVCLLCIFFSLYISPFSLSVSRFCFSKIYFS